MPLPTNERDPASAATVPITGHQDGTDEQARRGTRGRVGHRPRSSTRAPDVPVGGPAPESTHATRSPKALFVPPARGTKMAWGQPATTARFVPSPPTVTR
jgi:hypothetical protein